MANTRQKNFGPSVTVGQTLTQRPSPTTLALGSSFINETTGEKYTVVRNTSGTHVWLLSGAGAALPASYKFAGGLTGAAGKVDAFLADEVPPASSAVAVGYPVAALGSVHGLKLNVTLNTLTTAATATVLVNGVPTLITIPIPAGATGAFSSSVVVPVVPGNQIDLLLDNTAGGVGNFLHCSAITSVS